MVFCHEVDLFDSSYLDKAFLWALAMEHKVAPRIRSPETRSSPSNVVPSTTHPFTYPTSFASPSTPNNAPWCTFHKTNLHASMDCRALKIFHNNKSLFA